MEAKDIFNYTIKGLIKNQKISDEEIDRICNKLTKIWLHTNSPHKYSVPAHEAEILIRTMQLELHRLMR